MVGPRYDHFVMRQYQATDAVGGDARASLLPAARRAIVAGVNTWAVIAARYNFTDVWRQQRVLVGKFLGTKNPEPPTLDAEGLRIKIVADKRHDIDKKRDEEVRKMEETIFLRSRRSYAESAVVYTKLLGDLQEKVLKPKFLAYIKEATFAAEPAEVGFRIASIAGLMSDLYCCVSFGAWSFTHVRLRDTIPFLNFLLYFVKIGSAPSIRG